MVKLNKNENLFNNLADDLSEDILNASDDDILKDAHDYHDSPQERAEVMRFKISDLIMRSRKKRRLIPAQEALKKQSTNSSFHKKIADWSIDKIKSMLDNVLPDGESLPNGLIVAFRNKENLSKKDLIHFAEDLYDLGLIKDE